MDPTSSSADDIEQWLNTYLDLREVIRIDQRVALGANDTLFAAVICWSDGFDIYTASAALESDLVNAPMPWTAEDDRGNKYQRNGGMGSSGSSRPRAIDVMTFSPELDPAAQELTLLNHGDERPLATVSLRRSEN